VAQEETIRFIDKKASNYGGFLVYIELERFEKNIVQNCINLYNNFIT
jgi:hypothetical protein